MWYCAEDVLTGYEGFEACYVSDVGKTGNTHLPGRRFIF